MMEQKQEIHATMSINNVQYEVIKDYRNGFREEAFKERYAEILNKYDYIVGDWGYDQLRLRGFLMIVTNVRHMIRKLVHYRSTYTSTVILVVHTLYYEK